MPELVGVAPGSPEWLAARRAGVTATDIVAITGLSATESAYSLYHRKLGNLPEHLDTDRWRLGHELEPIIAARFSEALECGTLADGGLFRSAERPWQMATIDRGYLGRPAELKSWADADRDRWDDGPPPAVRAQVLWQMDVMGVATGHVGVLFLPSGEFRAYVTSHLESCIASDKPFSDTECQVCNDQLAMFNEAAKFMDRLNGDAPPPSPDGSAATLAALKARYAEPRNDKIAPVDAELWKAYDCHKEKIAWHKYQAKLFEAEIREAIGEAGVIEVDGEIVARRTISTVKAHYRKEGKRDVITRVKRKDGDNDD